MKKLLIIALCAACAALSTGCAIVNGQRTMKDGSVVRIESLRLLWSSEDISFSDGAGGTFSVRRSNADAQAMAAIAEGATRGAVSGVKP